MYDVLCVCVSLSLFSRLYIFLLHFARGVFQGLIEKHFPVPDWRSKFPDVEMDNEVSKQMTAGQQKKRKG